MGIFMIFCYSRPLTPSDLPPPRSFWGSLLGEAGLDTDGCTDAQATLEVLLEGQEALVPAILGDLHAGRPWKRVGQNSPRLCLGQ